MGRINCCHVSLAFVLKLLNFLQAFVGLSIIAYSLWMLNQWAHRLPPSPPPFPPFSPSPSPASASGLPEFLNYGISEFGLNSFRLPAPWFIYSFMGVGIILCCITLIGCIAAESIHGCCLCFYTILKTVLILLEVALVAFITIDHHWEEDLPFDPTGDLEGIRSFIEKNVDICKWVGITIISIQAVSLLLAIVLRGMISTRKTDPDGEDDFGNVRAAREPLLHQATQTSGSGAWSLRMREKYGLSSGGGSSELNQKHQRD